VRRRAVEIKHGRIAMYATIGFIVSVYYKAPGYLSPSRGMMFSTLVAPPSARTLA
jgi:hypothetical protein